MRELVVVFLIFYPFFFSYLLIFYHFLSVSPGQQWTTSIRVVHASHPARDETHADVEREARDATSMSPRGRCLKYSSVVDTRREHICHAGQCEVRFLTLGTRVAEMDEVAVVAHSEHVYGNTFSGCRLEGTSFPTPDNAT